MRDSSTPPSNGPVKEARGRRGLRQTSWEAQLPVDHADSTDRTIFVSIQMRYFSFGLDTTTGGLAQCPECFII
ncbi:hypothetical protein PV326_011629 [Microctonus aethiopoides]|nr:hypothetical protein PV326_011629 [Microctonus aethiopoides]